MIDEGPATNRRPLVTWSRNSSAAGRCAICLIGLGARSCGQVGEPGDGEADVTEIRIRRRRHLAWAPVLLLLLIPLAWYLMRMRAEGSASSTVVRDTGTVPADVPLPPAARAAATVPLEAPGTAVRKVAPKAPAPTVSVPKIQPADPVAAARSTTTPAARP